MTKQSDLLAYVFEGQRHPLSAVMVQWMAASPRFTLFVEANRDKIRKKIRITREPENALDLRGELELAYRLLADRRLDVRYEPYASAKTRGPDFAVTYRVNLLFNMEVARIRAEGSGVAGIDLLRKEERLLRILMDKLGQMQPGMPNLLAVQVQEELVRSLDLGRLMQDVKLRAERKDSAFYALGRYPTPAAFYRDFLHLSGILVWGGEVQLWVNKQARPGLDEKVLRLVCSLLSNEREILL